MGKPANIELYSGDCCGLLSTNAFEFCTGCDGGKESVSLPLVLKDSSLQELVTASGFVRTAVVSPEDLGDHFSRPEIL